MFYKTHPDSHRPMCSLLTDPPPKLLLNAPPLTTPQPHQAPSSSPALTLAPSKNSGTPKFPLYQLKYTVNLSSSSPARKPTSKSSHTDSPCPVSGHAAYANPQIAP